MADIAHRAETALATLAVEIRREVDAAEADFQSAVSHAIRAGELLIEAKAQVNHGDWLPWLAVNCPLSERQASNYMRLARNRQRVADLPSVREAVALLTAPKPEASRPNPIDAAVAKREAARAKADAMQLNTYEDHTAAARAWLDVAEANRDVIRELARAFCVQSVEAESEGTVELAAALARAGSAGMVWAAHYEPWDPAHDDAVAEWDAALDAIENGGGKS